MLLRLREILQAYCSWNRCPRSKEDYENEKPAENSCKVSIVSIS